MPTSYGLEIISVLAILVGGYVVLRLLRQKNTRSVGATSRTLEAFTKDFSKAAAEGSFDPICCRETEIERMIHILLRRKKNNPILIGDPGVGKTAIVEALAQRILNGEVPSVLKNARIVALQLHDLMAGTKLRGEFESRLSQLMEVLENPNETLILFIDEIHLLEQAGRSEGSLSMSDVLKPGLARNDYRVIGATTWEEYTKYILPNEPLARRLQPVLIDEPTRDQAINILMATRHIYESFHHVTITDDAIQAAVRLADEHIDLRFLPDSAIDLIDEAAAKIAVEAERSHHLALGVVHTASSQADTEVGVDDIQSVIEQWVAHGKEQRKRDPRHLKSS
jgi:ATP-dependent Clp protease ATP-binding subunit ClpC